VSGRPAEVPRHVSGGPPKRRPKGLTAIALLLIANGAYNTVDGLRSIQTHSVLEWSLLLLSGLTALACGFGCWTRQPWARIATVVGLAANIPFRLISTPALVA
jgi:hypothetical protein